MFPLERMEVKIKPIKDGANVMEGTMPVTLINVSSLPKAKEEEFVKW